MLLKQNMCDHLGYKCFMTQTSTNTSKKYKLRGSPSGDDEDPSFQ